MSLRKLSLLLGLCVFSLTPAAFALGLGEIKLYSTINQPFNAEVPLTNVGSLGKDEIVISMASQEEFVRYGLEREYFFNDFKFEVMLTGEGAPKVRISSHNIVREPYLSFLVEARWPSGRFHREYTLLMEKPAVIE